MAEYWRVRAHDPDAAPVVEVHTGVDREAGTYTDQQVFTGEQSIRSGAFPEIKLRPADLLPGDGPLVPGDPKT